MRYFFTAFFICVFTILYLLLNVKDVLTAFLLIINTFIITKGIYNSLRKQMISIDLIYWVFNIFFFVFAISEQIKHPYFPNYYPVNILEVNYGLILICCWNFVFLLFRNNHMNMKVITPQMKFIDKLIAIQPLYLMISWISFLSMFLILGKDYFFGYTSIIDLTNEKTLSTLISTVIRGIAFSAFVFQLTKMKNNFISYLRLILTMIPLFYLVSPFNTTRYITGFFIILAIWIFLRKKISANSFFVCLVVGILVIFPFLNVFMTEGYVNNIEFNINDSLSQFRELHFDAFASFLSIISYTELNGLLLGANFLGAALFFVPSAIWTNKPLGSGSLVGEYLINHYGFTMDNLSSPLISEFYLSFGIIGILIGALIFAVTINWIETKMLKGFAEYDLLYGIIAGYLFIILRGSFMVAFASIVGSIVIMIIIPNLFSNYILHNKREDILE